MSHPTNSKWIITSNHGSGKLAQNEIRNQWPKASFSELDGEMQLMELPADKNTVWSAFRINEPVFIRHLHPVDIELPYTGAERDVQSIASATALAEPPWPSGAKLAVQARKTEAAQPAYTPYAVKQAVDERLASGQRLAAVVPVVNGADWIVSVCLDSSGIYIGLSAASDNLSDWAGGAMRFRKEEGQISRAQFKLLEAEVRFALQLGSYEQALDIGAAPGGWTSLLLERGAHVTAVDPGELHPSLRNHPRLTYLRKNAAEIAFSPGQFDLLLCDMSWSPRQMVKLLLPLADSLRTGGTAIVTLKLMHGKPFQTIKDTARTLSPQLRLVQAKQLFHNRDEVTLLLLKESLEPGTAD